MTTFYTNVQTVYNKIYYRGIQNGKRVKLVTDYSPSIFLSIQPDKKYITPEGKPLGRKQFNSIKECRKFIKDNESVENITVYGNTRFEYAYISDMFPQEVIEWDRQLINVCNLDIECGSDNGFPNPGEANEEITAITLRTNAGEFVSFGCGNFVPHRNDVRYVQCRDETDLLKRFVDYWTGNTPDIITGWNVKMFDIPYIVNRIRKLFGEDTLKRLSPFGKINERMIAEMRFGQRVERQTYEIVGISVIDYIEIYKKYAPQGKSRDSYRLDAIAHYELGERKVSYEDYGSLHNLYKSNYQLFMEYNIRDVELVDKLEDELKLINLAITLAFDTKTNFEDVFSQVRMWDSIIFNYVRQFKMVVPPRVDHDKSSAYVGAYVKEPLLGFHQWVVSFDLNSLYPHLIMQYNISPDTIIDAEQYDDKHRKLLSDGVSVEKLLFKGIDTTSLTELNCTMTPNGQFFRLDKHGFLPQIMEKMYNDRVKYKKEFLKAKKQLEKESDPEKRGEIERRISIYNNLQLAKKVGLNSAYGALGNQYFRFFDVRQASAVTTAGQLSIRWIENALNGYMNKLLKTKDKDYVIAVDTDSVYLSLDTFVSEIFPDQSDTRKVVRFLDKVCEEKFQKFIDKSYRDLATYVNAYDQKMIMKREAIANKGIWTAKKRYILNVFNSEGVEYAEPEIKVMGLEMVKSSTPYSVREKLEQAIKIIINGNQEEMLTFIENYRKEFETLPLGDIAFPRSVNGISKYTRNDGSVEKRTPIHVRGAIIFNTMIRAGGLENKYEEIKEGEKIKYIYLQEPNHTYNNVISFNTDIPEEFDLKRYVDYDTQLEKAFIEPLKVLLDQLGWETKRQGTKISRLFT